MLDKHPSRTSISETYTSALALFFECEAACFLWGRSACRRKDERHDKRVLEGHGVEKGAELVLCSSRRQHWELAAVGGGIFSLQWNNGFPPQTFRV